MKKALIRFLNKIITILIYKQKQIEVLALKHRENAAIHPTFYVGAGTFIDCKPGISRLQIGADVVMRRNCNVLMYPGSTLVIHPGVFFNNQCTINVLGHVEIGEKTLFGEGVRIYDHNHQHSYDAAGSLDVKRDDFKIGKVSIGRNCWIGSNVVILNNVEIGDNCIIGAGCLIYKNVPANSIVKLNVQATTAQAPPAQQAT